MHRRRRGRQPSAVMPAPPQPRQADATAVRPCPHRLWTRLRTDDRESGFTPCAARGSRVWTNIRQSPLPGRRTERRAKPGRRRREGAHVDSGARTCVIAKPRPRCPQTLWTRLRTHAGVACFTPCAASPAGVWLFFVHIAAPACADRDGQASARAMRRIGAGAAFSPRLRPCPHALWTRLRTDVRESGFTPCAARLARDWRKYRQAIARDRRRGRERGQPGATRAAKAIARSRTSGRAAHRPTCARPAGGEGDTVRRAQNAHDAAMEGLPGSSSRVGARATDSAERRLASLQVRRLCLLPLAATESSA